LTYSFDENTVYWPTAQPFHFEKEKWGISPAGYWYSAGRYSASEHGGTHLDSPIHFGQGQAATDQLAVSRLAGPAIVIDITAACSGKSDYRLTVDDIARWERKHGRILPHTIVLVRTGWGRFWPDKKRYLGSDRAGDTGNLHFPGLSRETADLLRQRNVDGVGIDTASLDYGASKDFIVHRILNEAGIYGLENIAQLEKLPETGATIIALPMKIKGGSGGPVRIVALLP
jgi:kynurenine formamidase